jgi:malonyl-CoA decarboxylase
MVQHLPVESGITLSDPEYSRLKELAPEESPPELIASGRWLEDEELLKAAQAPVMRMCAHYLTQEHRTGQTAVLNSVAHFHLSNGARLARINWQSDLSENGLRQSYGLMVNYIYKRDEIELNHEQYVAQGEVCCDPDVTALLTPT